MRMHEEDIKAMAGLDQMHHYFLRASEEEESEAGEFLRHTKELLPYTPLEYQEAFFEAFREAWQGFDFRPTRFTSSGFGVSD